MSLDAYRRHVDGAITIAVTDTDHPVAGQDRERSTPTQPTPAVTVESTNDGEKQKGPDEGHA